MIDYSAGEITTEESKELIGAIQESLSGPNISFYPGISYRHCMVWSNGLLNLELTPPHDIFGQIIGDFLPKGDKNRIISELMEKSYHVLKDHPINQARIAKGLSPANSIWLWGEGKKPSLPSFEKSYGKKVR